MREGGLSERHARALLRLSDENERLAALRVIVERGCNVAQAEAYIESVLQRAAVTPPRRRPTFIVKDVWLFLNTIRRSMGIMQRAGVDAGVRAGGHGRGDPADHPHPAHGGCQNGVKIVTKSLLFFAKSMLYCNRLAVVYTAGY